MSRGQIVALAGAGALVTSAFLPWISASAAFIGTRTKTGTEGDGIITLVAGVVIGLAVLISKDKQGKLVSLVVALIGLVCGVIVAIDFSNVVILANDPDFELAAISVGPGLYLTGIGCVLAFVGGLMHLPVLAVAE